jgi:hypothetical protein
VQPELHIHVPRALDGTVERSGVARVATTQRALGFGLVCSVLRRRGSARRYQNSVDLDGLPG